MQGRPPTSERPSVRRPNPTAAFAAECGLRGPLRFMVENTESSQSQTFDVFEPFVLIGQSSGCHLRLMHPDVSFRHAYCQVVQGRLYVYDLDTEHGTVWGAGVRREGSLTPDSRLQIGPFIVRLSRAPAFTCSLQPTTEDWQPDNEPLEDVRLWFENATGRSSHSALRPLRRQITLLGRSNRCHLKLSDASVSKAHCAIVRTEVGSWVVDLLGRAGTTINGQSVRFSPIRADDCLGAGRFRMKIRELLQSESLDAPVPGSDSDVELPIAPQVTERPGAKSIVLPRSPVAVTDQQLVESRQSLSFHAARLPDISPPEGERGTSDALILAMMEQFSHLQQQLLTHTQQQMSMLTEMFATLHKAQNEAVMSQLQRIQEISTELNTLRAETAAGRAEANGSVSAAPLRASHPLVSLAETETRPASLTTSLLSPSAGNSSAIENPQAFAPLPGSPPETGGEGTESPAVQQHTSTTGEPADGLPDAALVGVPPVETAPQGPYERESVSTPVVLDEDGPLSDAVNAADGEGGWPDADDSDVVPIAPMDVNPAAELPAASDALETSGTDEPEPPKSQKSAATRPRKAAPRQLNANAHARLTMRISELERERTGSWKKLMQLVGGALDE